MATRLHCGLSSVQGTLGQKACQMQLSKFYFVFLLRGFRLVTFTKKVIDAIVFKKLILP